MSDQNARGIGRFFRGDDAGQAALAPPAHEVGHRGERQTARLVRHVARGDRREHLRFVDDDQRGIPFVARSIEQRVEEQ